MTDMQKKRKDWRVTGLGVVTDLVDPRPRRLVKYLNDYTLLLGTASFSVGHGEVSPAMSAPPGVHIQIRRLSHTFLKAPLDVLVERDEQGFVARTPDLPLSGHGKDRIEAVDMLKREIESLCEDLLKQDHVDEEWLGIKEFLAERIAPDK